MNERAIIETGEQRDGPSLFVGIALEIEEISLCDERLATPCGTLRAALIGKRADEIKQAAEQIANIAGQMQSLSKHLATVIARHQGRIARIAE